MNGTERLDLVHLAIASIPPSELDVIPAGDSFRAFLLGYLMNDIPDDVVVGAIAAAHAHIAESRERDRRRRAALDDLQEQRP